MKTTVIRLAALLCAALLTASCSDLPAPDAASAARSVATQPSGPELSLQNCTNLGAVFPVPVQAARAALPAGFEPVVSGGDPAGGAILYVLGLRCEQSRVDGTEHGPALLAYAELAVTPPAEFALDEIADYTVPLLFTATPAAVGDALQTFQFGEAGAGTISWEDLTPLGGTVVTATLGSATLTLTAEFAPTAPAALGSGGFALFGVQNGSVRSIINGYSEGGASVQGIVRMESSGGPAVLQQARQAARGFSVSGFSLNFTPAVN